MFTDAFGNVLFIWTGTSFRPREINHRKKFIDPRR